MTIPGAVVSEENEELDSLFSSVCFLYGVMAFAASARSSALRARFFFLSCLDVKAAFFFAPQDSSICFFFYRIESFLIDDGRVKGIPMVVTVAK